MLKTTCLAVIALGAVATLPAVAQTATTNDKPMVLAQGFDVDVGPGGVRVGRDHDRYDRDRYDRDRWEHRRARWDDDHGPGCRTIVSRTMTDDGRRIIRRTRVCH